MGLVIPQDGIHWGCHWYSKLRIIYKPGKKTVKKKRTKGNDIQDNNMVIKTEKNNNNIRKESNAKDKNKQIKVKKRGEGMEGNGEQRKVSQIRK